MNTRIHSRRSQAARSKATQEGLIDSAIRIISDRGLEAVTLQEVAREAGVTPGAIQHHFESKAALMMRVLGTLIEKSNEAGELWPHHSVPIAARARQFVHNAWALIYERPRFIAAWTAYLACRTQPALLDHIAGQRKQLLLRMQAGFLESFPELADDPEAASFIELVFSTLRGLGLLGLFPSAHEATSRQLECLAALIADRCQRQFSDSTP